MNTELVAALGIIAASVISGMAAIFAAKAEKNSRPVSNGFVPELRHDIRELRSLLLDHLKEHSKG
jgi:hypothetical protein